MNPLRDRVAADASLTEQIVAALSGRESELDEAANAFVKAAGDLARAYEDAETMRNFALAYLPHEAWQAYRKDHPRPPMPDGNNPPRYFVRPKVRK